MMEGLFGRLMRKESRSARRQSLLLLLQGPPIEFWVGQIRKVSFLQVQEVKREVFNND